MFKKFNLTLVTLFMLWATLPALVICLVAMKEIYDINYTNALKELDLKTKNLAITLDHGIGLITSAFITLSSNNDVIQGTVKSALGIRNFMSYQAVEYMSEFKEEYPLVAAIYLIDGNGEIVESIPEKCSRKLPNDLDRAIKNKTTIETNNNNFSVVPIFVGFDDKNFLINILEFNTASTNSFESKNISKPQKSDLELHNDLSPSISDVSSHHGIAMLVPLVDKAMDEVKGYLLAIIPINNLAALALSNIENSAGFHLLQNNKSVLIDNQLNSLDEENSLNEKDIRSKEVTFTLKNRDKNNSLVYQIFLNTNSDIVFSKLHDLTLKFAVGIFAMLIFLLALAYPVARWLASPIKNLTAVVNSFADGSFFVDRNSIAQAMTEQAANRKIEQLITFIEFQETVEVLQTMGRKILEQITELKTLNRELEIVNDQLENANIELEAVNSELESVNLELRSVNKELESVNQALSKSEKQYRDIFENALEGIFQTSFDATILNANASFARILGYDSPLEIMSIKGFTKSLYVNPFERDRIISSLKQNGIVIGHELEAYNKNRQIINVYMSVKIVNDEFGNPAYMEGSIIDITEKKDRENAVKEREAAEASNRAKSAFLANMSHEIRTPMNAIIGFAGLILKTSLTYKQRDYLSKIDSSAKSLLGIINDILDFSKIEAGKLSLEEIDFQLSDVINSVAGLVSVKASEKGIELIHKVDCNVPSTLIGDPLRLGQVLTNLVNNAVKFTESGHIFIKAELAAPENQDNRVSRLDSTLNVAKIDTDTIETAALNGSKTFCSIKFSVQDTGIGMSKEQTARLFSAFSQADSSITRKFGGTGLGLTISKRLVEMMGGDIEIQSEPGKGSTFSFTATFKSPLKMEEETFKLPHNIPPLKVLIVDDHPMARQILAEQLLSFNFGVKAVDSGQAALAELEKADSRGEPYNLVLMDWKMPGMNGIEVSKLIKKDNRLSKTPLIIMVSAFGREEMMKQVEKEGIHSFLMKPVSPSLMLETIMQIFGDESLSSPTATRILPSSIIDRDGKVDNLDVDSEIGDMANQTIEGAKILLVEDHILNQQVAKEILEGFGLIVDIADNGNEAIKSVSIGEYELVFMDVQMPVMGGYEATRLIKLDPRFKDLPIVAMTAHAMRGAREECLNAGMDDYISKPIDPAELLEILTKWINPAKRVNYGISKVLEDEKIAESLAHKDREQQDVKTNWIELPSTLPGVDIEAGVKRINNNRKLYKQFLIDFRRKYKTIPYEITKLIENNNINDAARTVHTFKGIAGNMSANRLFEIAKELEMVLRHHSDSNNGSSSNSGGSGTAIDSDNSCLALAEKLIEETDILINALAAWIDADDSKPVESLSDKNELPVDLEIVSQVVNELSLLLKDNNYIDALKSLSKLKNLLGNDKIEIIDKIDTLINDLEFDQADNILRTIKIMF
ncbi:MAG: response regulator [Desulfamplus sp.]|nr:response regulator [Desulfamplus sp.]